MTMANSTLSSPSRNGVSLRKTNKPLMEKRRRARINDSLLQLKSLVIQGTKKDSSQFNKLEKADILELTVKHLRSLQAQQQQQQHHMNQAANNDPSLAGKYQAGFIECANEVIRYLGQSQGFSDDIKSRVVGHLASCLQLSSKPSFIKPMQPNNIVTASPTVVSVNKQPTSAQLPNGQIIQIVNAPFQNMKSSPVCQYSSAQAVPIAPAPLPVSSTTSASSHIPTAAVISVSSNSPPVSEQSHYIRYTQPLHIQIPPVLSPVLIQSHPVQKLAQPQVVSRVQEGARLPHPQQETVVSTTTSPSPQPRDRSISPTPLRTSHKYYIPEDLSSDYIPRSRNYSVASSASSESELTSPLNLSQSPPYYDTRKEYIRKHVSSQNSYLSDKASPSHPFTSSNYLPTSVIVDGRKTVDSHAFKFMHMDMDDDRHCIRHEGSTSPASSVGEERLWRPW